MYVDDDLISSQYSWTAISFFEILIIQNILAAVLAYWSIVLKCYPIKQPVVARLTPLMGHHPQDNQEEQQQEQVEGMRGSDRDLAVLQTHSSDESDGSTYTSLLHPGPASFAPAATISASGASAGVWARSNLSPSQGKKGGHCLFFYL